jgi:WD40 repeat protein
MRPAAFVLAILTGCLAWPGAVTSAPVPPRPAPLPPGALFRLGSEYLRHPHALSAAYSPDGRFLATGGKDVRLWHVQARTLHRALPLPGLGDDRRVAHLQFTPDGKALHALGYSEGGVFVLAFEAPSGKLLHRFQRRTVDQATAAALSPDGQVLAIGTMSPPGAGDVKTTLSLWSVTTKKKLRDLPGHKRTIPMPPAIKDFLMVESAAFSPDGKWLASLAGHQDEAVRVFEVATGKEKYALRRHRHVQGGRLTFSPQGHLAVVSSPEPFGPNYKPVLTLWDLTTGKIKQEIADPPGWHAITFSPDGKWLAAGVPNNDRVCVWERATGKVRFTTPPGHPGYALAFAKDGDTLISCCSHSALSMWDLKRGRDVLEDEGHTGAIGAVDVSADGKTIATGSQDGFICLWDVKSRKARRLCRINGTGAISVSFSPNGKTLATSAYLSGVILWDVATGKELRRFPDHERMWGHRVAFSPDGKTLVVVNSYLVYTFYDVQTGAVKHSLSWYGGGGLPDVSLPLRRLPFRFSPDGKRFAGLFAPRQGEFAVALWEVGKEARQIVSTETGHVLDIAFSPDGEYLAWSDRDNVHIWDVRVGRLAKKLPNVPHSTCLAFTPDGRYLVNGKVLHPLILGRKQGELPVQPDLLGFSRNGGLWVVVAQNDCTMLVLDPKKFGR